MSLPLNLASDIVNSLPRKLANHYRLVAIGLEGNAIILATDDAVMPNLQDELEVSLDFNFVLRQISTIELNSLLHKYYFEDQHTQGQEKSTLQYNADFLETLILLLLQYMGPLQLGLHYLI